MITKIIEVTNEKDGHFNHGKFLVARFTDEWHVKSAVAPPFHVLTIIGTTHQHVLILDLETGEGAIFRPGGLPSADLNKHRIWVCPMFEPFLEWLYLQIEKPTTRARRKGSG